jgi:hypothetical protein
MVAIELDTPVARLVVVSLPLELYREALQLLAHCSGFVQLTRDAAEVTLIIDEIEWAKWAGDFPGARASTGWRLIRFDLTLDFTVVGFMAEVTRLMAGEGISLLAISSWRTDGLLVGENHFDRAVTILRGAKHLAALAGTE